MKTIVETATGLSKYLLEDTVAVTLNDDTIVVDDPAMFIIADLNAGNAAVYEGVTAPEGWTGNKYTFDGSVWALNPDWVDPEAPAQPQQLQGVE
jgi:hypothetical protein